MNFFKKDLTAFSKKLHLRCLRRFWICLWHRSLKYCNFKTSNPPWKMKKRLYILYILNKATLKTKNGSIVLHNLLLLDMFIFNGLVIKNDSVKKSKIFHCFYVGDSTASHQFFVLEETTFHCKVLCRLYCNSKFNILANFNLLLSTS